MEILLTVGILLISVFTYGFIYRKKLYKEVDRLEVWKIDISNRPVTNEMAKVKQLNMTGQTEELFEKWRNTWDDIVTTRLPNIEEYLFDVEEYADRYRFGKGKATIEEASNLLQGIETDIQSILLELEELVGSEEKNRTEIEDLKEQHRLTKKRLLTNLHFFHESEAKLHEMLQEVSVQFTVFENETVEGNYLEAREVVLNIRVKLDDIATRMNELPHFWSECQTELPSQLSELSLGYQEMLRQGYNLESIPVPTEVDEMEQELIQIRSLLISAEVIEVNERMNAVKDRMETLYDLLEKEVISRHYVNDESIHLRKAILEFKADVEETKEETIHVQQSYQLTDELIEQQRQMEKWLTMAMKRLSAIEGKLVDQQCSYSLLREEIEDLYEQLTTVLATHEEYRQMLQMLRKDEKIATEKLNELKLTLQEIRRLLDKSNLPGVPEPFMVQIQDARNALLEVSVRLEDKPLNMIAVQGLLAEAVQVVTRTHSATTELVEQAILAERVIQYGNRYRAKNETLATRLAEAEWLFRHLDYANALEQAAAAIEQVEPGALKRIENIVNEEQIVSR